MKILITGGAGYLGSILTEELLLNGWDVTVVDSFMYRQTSLSHLAQNKHLTIIKTDARDLNGYSAAFKEADAIIPLAAIVGAPACALDVTATWSTNCDQILDVVFRAADEQMIIYPNTNSGYGIGDDGMCTEASLLNPISVYGQTKVRAENIVLEHKYGVVFRFATLFGASPRMRLDLMVNDFVYQALRNKALVLWEGHFRRNFLHVRDAASAFEHVLMSPEGHKQEIYNVGDTRANMTKLQLAQKISQHLPIAIFEGQGEKDPDQRDYIVSNAKFEATGWEPERTLDEGIVELIRCYKQPFNSYGNV